ncbi:hypothetical protein BaRGS_00024374 [Batillaria attramentaria]|uniref:VQ domain-containing protein n=1 Tax=Batillaria attramentaria TaxID=370345 RepID=A0ABD0KBB0_9CAEN
MFVRHTNAHQFQSLVTKLARVMMSTDLIMTSSDANAGGGNPSHTHAAANIDKQRVYTSNTCNRSDEVYWHVQHHKQDAVAKNSERRAVIQPQRTATRIGSGGSKCVKVNIPRRTSMNTPPTTMPVFRNTPLSVANSLHATYGCQMRLHGTLLVTKTCSHRVRTVTLKQDEMIRSGSVSPITHS